MARKPRAKAKKPAPTKEPLKDRLQRLKVAPPVIRSDAEVKAWEREMEKLTSTQFVGEQIQEIKQAISKQPPHEQLLLSFMPTTMTRTSPFFPMSRPQAADRPFDKLVWETSWGRVEIKGERLSVYDESVLLGLLAMVRKNRSAKIETTVHELGKLIGSRPGGSGYKAIWNAIDMLAGATIKIETYMGKGRKRKLKLGMIGHIISRAATNTKKIRVEIDPYFLTMYAEGLTTNLDLSFRAQIKGDIGKVMYRFLQGQRNFYKDGVFKTPLSVLCPAINIDITQKPLKEVRRQIRTALSELRRLKYVKRWMITKTDYVMIWKA